MLSPRKNVELFADPTPASLLGDITPPVILEASIVVALNELQLSLLVELVFTVPNTCTFCLVKVSVPVPVLENTILFVTRPLILANASLRDACIVNELVVTDPAKKNVPVTIGEVPTTGKLLPVNRNGSPVVIPCSAK